MGLSRKKIVEDIDVFEVDLPGFPVKFTVAFFYLNPWNFPLIFSTRGLLFFLEKPNDITQKNVIFPYK